MKKLIFSIITLISINLSAQDRSGNVSGQIIDGNAKTIESATISLLRAKDSSVYKFTAADKLGFYSFEAPAGRFLVSVTAVGHSKGFSETFEISQAGQEVKLKTIEIFPQSKSLANVTITAKKPLIEQKIDRTVVNVEASVTNVGASALEVLEKSPGITVDKDGNISLKGKEGVLVLVDGRPTQLSGTDLANLLRNIHASTLDQIEIMTNPPARFDAAGNAGVINIKTKKNKMAGYNGTLNLGYSQGRYARYNEGLTFNYKEGKVNLFGNVSHNYHKGQNRLNIQRKIFDTTTGVLENHFDMHARMMNDRNNFNGRIGLDYSPSKRTTIGFVVNGATSPGNFVNQNYTLISDAGKLPESQTKASAAYDQTWKNFSTNLNFRRALDTTGKELTADLDYISYLSGNDQLLVNAYYNASGNQIGSADSLVAALPQDIKIYSGRIDYYQPLKKGAKFEAGLKSSIVRTDNNAVYDSLQNGTRVHDFGRSNHFIYEENINAAYVNLSGSLSKKINGQLGLRLENTTASGTQVITGQKVNQDYTQLFPTAFLQYKANDKNNFGINYGRRIRRPNYESLNPFIRFLDRYTYQQGNPNLKPQFSHNIELSHTYRNFITTTVNYTHTTDIIQQVIEQKGKDGYAKQQNIAELKQYGIAVNANHSVTKWWTSSLYGYLFHNNYKGEINKSPIELGTTTFIVNGSQQFKFAKTWTAEISGMYRTSGVEGVLKTDPMGLLSVGMSKTVFANKGTIRAGLRDVFHSQKMTASSKYKNVDMTFTEIRDSRVFSLGFSYRFSKGKISQTKKRTNGSASEEQGRAGGGSNQ
jgi:iron complex outermembrane receptor protein